MLTTTNFFASHAITPISGTNNPGMDSQCKFGVVARGQASLYLRLSDREQKIWDIAPGTLVVEEAGGQARGNWGVLHFGRAQGLVL